MGKQKDNPKWTLGAIMNTFGMKRKFFILRHFWVILETELLVD